MRPTAPVAEPAAPVAEPAADRPASAEQPPTDPWDRYGWVMGAIWLVFLAFPVVGSVQSDLAIGWRVASVTSIVAFAAVYVVGFVLIDRFATTADLQRFGWRWLLLLASLCVVPAVVIGAEALGMLPFMVAFAMFSIDLRFAIALSVAAIGAAIAIPYALGTLNELWFFVLIVALVAVSTGFVRFIEDRQITYRALSKEVTIVSERERVARDVHDVLGHSLTVITVKSELARRLLDVDPERAKAELDDVMALSRTALAEVRATVSGLRVARLDVELEAAAAALGGADIAADLPADPSVADPRHRIVLAWVLREAVTNVVRHSGASRCTVTLRPNGILVEDDGAGLAGVPEGNGLRGLRERVASVGGRLDIGSGVGGSGTRLEVTL